LIAAGSRTEVDGTGEGSSVGIAGEAEDHVEVVVDDGVTLTPARTAVAVTAEVVVAAVAEGDGIVVVATRTAGGGD
jgi:hypothetical protein